MFALRIGILSSEQQYDVQKMSDKMSKVYPEWNESSVYGLSKKLRAFWWGMQTAK